MDHGEHADDADNTCLVSILWNWHTIDACFLAESWHIRNRGMFAATCIGVALLVVLLELLRRAGKENDAFVRRQFKRNLAGAMRSARSAKGEGEEEESEALFGGGGGGAGVAREGRQFVAFRATLLQQLVRSLIHAATLGLAYIVMLLVMYFNGYIVISVILGGFIGKFFCDWLVVEIPLIGSDERTEEGGIDEASVCCN